MRPPCLTSVERVWIFSGTAQYTKQCLVNNPCTCTMYILLNRERHVEDNLCGPKRPHNESDKHFKTTLSTLFRFGVPPNSVIAQCHYLTTKFQLAFSAGILQACECTFVLGYHLGFGNCGRLE